jgi:hypothetical protein
MLQSDNMLAIHLQQLEESLLQSTVRKSELVSQLLSDEFIEVGSSGHTYTKEQIMTALQAESPDKYTATAFNVKLLAPQTALVIYRACRHSEPPVFSVRSSIWQLRDGQWKLVFHQGTICSSHE